MRDLLFLSHRIPYPPKKGDKIRAWHTLRHLARRRRVYVGCFVDDEQDWADVHVLRDLAVETCILSLPKGQALSRTVPALVTGEPLTVPYYFDPAMARWTARVRRTRDCSVLVYSSSMAQYVAGDGSSPRIIDFVDVDSQKWCAYARTKRWPVSQLYRRECAALLATERRIAAEFDASIFVSDAEAALFRRLAPESASKVFAVSIGVDTEHYSPDLAHADPYHGRGRSVVCFTGMMDYWPNVDAVSWFAAEALPRLRRLRPDVTFYIVGANPVRAVQRLGGQPGIVVTGRVPDTRPYLAHASVVVAPLRIARGIQSKVLEAMAMGRPVVASEPAFEGLRVGRDRDVLVTNTADGFVEAITEVWNGRGAALGAAAMKTVRDEYRWPEQLSALDAIFESIEHGAEERASA